MTRQRYNLVLSVHATARGLAYVLFEGEANPVDWGRAECRGPLKNHLCIDRFIGLIELHCPDVVILQDHDDLIRRRSNRAGQLAWAFAAHAEGHGIPFVTRSRRDVLTAFAHLCPCTKQAIVKEIIEMIPVFAQHTPRIRKPWMSEDARMGLFDAAALALSFFAEQNSFPENRAA